MGRPAAEETINDPNNPRHYWRYRIHYNLEDVLEDEPLISDLQALLLGAEPLHVSTSKRRFLSSCAQPLVKLGDSLNALAQLQRCGLWS